jgi:hypothetical protein
VEGPRRREARFCVCGGRACRVPWVSRREGEASRRGGGAIVLGRVSGREACMESRVAHSRSRDRRVGMDRHEYGPARRSKANAPSGRRDRLDVDLVCARRARARAAHLLGRGDGRDRARPDLRHGPYLRGAPHVAGGALRGWDRRGTSERRAREGRTPSRDRRRLEAVPRLDGRGRGVRRLHPARVVEGESGSREVVSRLADHSFGFRRGRFEHLGDRRLRDP